MKWSTKVTNTPERPELSDNLRDMAVKAAEKYKGIDTEADPPMDKDNCLMQPMENWDRTDRKGSWGDSFMSVPTKQFKDNFDIIDWEN